MRVRGKEVQQLAAGSTQENVQVFKAKVLGPQLTLNCIFNLLCPRRYSTV